MLFHVAFNIRLNFVIQLPFRVETMFSLLPDRNEPEGSEGLKIQKIQH